MNCECQLAGWCPRWNCNVNSQMISWCKNGEHRVLQALSGGVTEEARQEALASSGVPSGNLGATSPRKAKSCGSCGKRPRKEHGRTAVISSRRTSGRTIGSAFRYMGGEIRFIKAAQFQEDIKTIIGKIPHDITAIAGVARSGLSAATMMAMYLHLPMLTIRQTMNDVVPTGNGWRLGGSKHIDPGTNRILVVDDTCMTGNSIKAIRPMVDRTLGTNCVYATVYCNPLALVKPDIHAVDLGWPHILEWNVFNSILSPGLATDFDGILCNDCQPWQDDDGPKYEEWIRNAVPLYTPRRCPIPLIVTARIEKYRGITEDWLRKHRIRWDRLVMHPAKTLRERNRTDIAAYKAHHFAAWAAKAKVSPGPVLFMESDDHQARRIGSITKRLCVCPSTAGVYS